MAIPQTVFDTRPQYGASSALWSMYKCDPNAYKWNIAHKMTSIANAVNELQDIVSTLSATPITVDPVEV